MVTEDMNYEEMINAPNSVYQKEDLFQLIEAMGAKDLHLKYDAKTGLKAIVAIHSIKNASSLGGCRFIEYPSTRAAIIDAMRLARGMSYKSAICNLSFGGAKAVIIKPPVIADREAFFKVFGQFVNQLGGRYITAKDSGTLVEDMDVIATETSYVTCTTPEGERNGDPSPYTAHGVLKGIEASVKYKLKREDLDGLHVAIQGVGHVGYDLAEMLHERGVKLTVTDIDANATRRCQEEFNAKVVDNDEIFHVECDVFSPCALGAILNEHTIPGLKAKIVAGSANNQLALERYGLLLKNNDILYSPDFVINSGGLIHAVACYKNQDLSSIFKQVDFIYERLIEIYERAEKEDRPINRVAVELAKECALKQDES